MPDQISPEMSLLAEVIAERISQQFKRVPITLTPKEFQLGRLLNISITDYVKRFAKYLELKEANLISVLIYFDRFVFKNPRYILSKFNIHLLLTTLFLAEHKVNNDLVYGQSVFMEIGVISLVEQLNEAERHFYALISWDLFVKKSTLDFYTKNLGLSQPDELTLDAMTLSPQAETSVLKTEVIVGKENEHPNTPAHTNSPTSPSKNSLLSPGFYQVKSPKSNCVLEPSEEVNPNVATLAA